MMNRRVVVTGLGMVSPIGNDVASSWQAALEGKSGIDRITAFDASAFGCQIAGEVKDFDAGKYLGVKEVRRFDRFVHFGVSAGIMALEDSGLEITDEFAPECGCAIGSGIGGLPLICTNNEACNERGPRRISPFLIPGCIINMTSGQLAIMKNLKGPNIAHVTACSTGLHAIGEAMHIIARGDATVMVAGGCESTIHPVGVGGFDNMHALSRRNDDPKTASRPFDKDRDGFVMGEGAGVLVLEELEHARARGARIYAELVGFATNCDATHITQPNSRTMRICMEEALRTAGLAPSDIGYLSAHGTATSRGDCAESNATASLFGNRTPVSSLKSFFGHTLGACGSIEAWLAIEMMREGWFSPTINLTDIDPECGELDYITGTERRIDTEFVQSNNFAFGGINTSLIFKRM